jgi:type IV pilus assembly protein PilV
MRTAPRRQQGVMLLEALIGILIFSIGILAMLGMQATAMRATMDAKYRAEAGYLVNQIIGTMWVDRTNLASYDTTSGAGNTNLTNWETQVSTQLPNASGANAPTIAVVGTQVTVTVKWKRPGEVTVSNQMAVAQINGSS